MLLSDFDYELPDELIAQTPAEPRSASRLMVLDPAGEAISHLHFYDLPSLLRPGDALVMNDTRVIPARLFGTKAKTGAKVEVLLLRRLGKDVWETLVRPGKKLVRTGSSIVFGEGLCGKVEGHTDFGGRVIRFCCDGVFEDVLSRLGEMPLPPYIHEKLADGERYQTVYSRAEGSAAAPTAGLHFTRELIDEVRTAGVAVGFVTLHVGLGTFRPVRERHIENHKMHTELYSVPEETARLVRETKAAGGRVIAVGTTSVRTLEAASDEDGRVAAKSGETDIFIYPGYRFRVVDAMITNFHLPESTLLMLVSAFAGRHLILRAYREAVAQRYRFFSFGDAMMITCRGKMDKDFFLGGDSGVFENSRLSEKSRRRLKSVRSENTLRAYESDWSDFRAWCEKNGETALPAEPETIVNYINDLADEAKANTVARRITAISENHLAAGTPRAKNPAKSTLVRAAVAAIRREKGTFQRGKAPVLMETLSLLSDCFTDDDIASVRDRALIFLGFAGAFRRSELVAVRAEHLTFSAEGLVVFVPRSKSDQDGRGSSIAIPYAPDPSVCAVRAVRAWLDASGIDAGAIFRPFKNNGELRSSPLSDKSVSLIIKKYVKAAGLDERDFAGHSLRRGFATSAAQHDVSALDIMRQTRHKTEAMVHRYIEQGNIFRESPLSRMFG